MSYSELVNRESESAMEDRTLVVGPEEKGHQKRCLYLAAPASVAQETQGWMLQVKPKSQTPGLLLCNSAALKQQEEQSNLNINELVHSEGGKFCRVPLPDKERTTN